MNVQVEHTDQHTARLLVTLDADKTEHAKQNAAKRLARQLRIPGFRPGKAPYKVVVQRLGDEAIVEEAADMLLQDTYKQALEQSEINPLTMGRFIDYQVEDGALKFTFEVPLQPEVTLGDYRAMRRDLEVEAVTDEMVDHTLQAMREERAVVEEVDRAAEIGDELDIELEIEWFHREEHDHDHEDDEEDEDEDETEEVEATEDSADLEESESETEAAEEESEAEDDDDDDDDEDEDDDDNEGGHWHTLVDDEEMTVIVREPGAENDYLPGFSERLIGLKAGDEIEYMMTLPDDYENEELAGQEVEVEVEVRQVRARTLPELNDMFAQNVTNGEMETLLELRMDVRKDLEEAAKNAAEAKLFDTVMLEIVEQAQMKYPEDLVQLYVDSILESMDQMMRQQFEIGLEDFFRVTGRSEADLRAEHRDNAEQQLRRELVYSELVKTEQLDITDADVDREIDRVAAEFGEQAALYRQLLGTPRNRENIANQLLQKRMQRRVADIVAGKEPPIGPEPEAEATAEPEASAVAAADVGSQITLNETGESTPIDQAEAPAETSEAENTSGEAATEDEKSE